MTATPKTSKITLSGRVLASSAAITLPMAVNHRPSGSHIPAFLTSGTFWAVATFAVAVVAVIVSYVLWRQGAPRKLLTWSTLATTPLLSNWPGLQLARLQVQMGDKPLTNPHVAILRVQNRSRRDIASDFDHDLPLRFDLGAKFMFAADAGSTIEYQPTLRANGTAITLGPVLMGGGKSLQLAVITDGRPHITCRSPLIGVKVKEQTSERLSWRVHRLVLSTIAGSVGLSLGMTSVFGFSVPLNVGGGAGILAISFMLLGLSSYISRTIVPKPRRKTG